MVRKLAFKLLSLLLVLPSAAYALGLGDIRLHSALNQPFNADIELLSASSSDIGSLKVSLASYDEFSRLGLDRPAVLMFLNFSVEQRDGTYYVKVSSKQPIKEPFLDFLVDVSWGSGQLLREYTVLLDPPKYGQEAAPAVQAPTVAPSAPVPAQAPAATAVAPAAPAPVAVTRPAPSMGVPSTQAAAMPAPAGTRKGLRYGPVKAKDTLWSIAERVRPSRSLTPQQVMVALLRANPDAFYDNNVNRLKKGYVLRLDNPSMIAAISQAEAVREIAHQNRAWRDYLKQAARSAQQRPSATTSMQAARAVATPEQAHLKLVAPTGKGTTVGGTAPGGVALGKETVDQLRQQLLLAQEQAAAQKQENTDLRKRMDDLQGQIASMQRLLSLKDTDMASLQQQMHGGETAKTAAAAPTAKPGQEAAAAGTKTAPVAEVKPTQPAAGSERKQAQPEAPAAGAKLPAPTAAGAKTPTPPMAKPAPHPVVSPKPAAPRSLMDSLLGDPVTLGAIGAVVLALLLLLGLIIKRRRAGGPGFSESILTAGGTSALSSKTVAGAPSEESSLFSDLAVSGMNSAQGGEAEVDPLTEADVYMAYGRYQQAEDLLNEALKHHPDRQDLKVKLLEVYYATKNSAAFESLAGEVFNALEGGGPLWGKVLVMGHELCPGNPMFSAAPEGGVGDLGHGEDALRGSDVLDIGIDLDALTADMESYADEGGSGLDMDLGVDFSDIGAEPDAAPTPAAPPAVEAAPAADLDFDLGGFEDQVAKIEPAEGAPATETTPLAEIELGDLDFGAPETSTAAPAVEESAPLESAPDAMDFDLGALALDEAAAPKDEIAVAAPAADENILDFDLGDMNLDLGGAMAEPSVGEADFGDLDLGDLDAVGTKLDLAKAYVDMGEPESARSILAEVMNEGDDAQKKQAQALMGQLG